jgi:hypothetical protein
MQGFLMRKPWFVDLVLFATFLVAMLSCPAHSFARLSICILAGILPKKH